ncbi:hypothetical protein [Vibrio crassostreae]|uniref:hypothetical protein n=1 Tax=Vibrio crassostreae TaxID=246167 RepID=UPI001B304727|nr:hypothetical protein [Vibrio crassostreae]
MSFAGTVSQASNNVAMGQFESKFFVKDEVVKARNCKDNVFLFDTEGEAKAYFNACLSIAIRFQDSGSKFAASKWVDLINHEELNKNYELADDALTNVLKTLGMEVDGGYYNEDMESFLNAMKREGQSLSLEWYISLHRTKCAQERAYAREIEGIVNRSGVSK